MHCEYIPRPLTYYQWNAQSISDAECRAETLRTDKVNDIRLKEKVADFDPLYAREFATPEPRLVCLVSEMAFVSGACDADARCAA